MPAATVTEALLQRTLGRWYFHRAGGRYRAGTYKGLDISFGSDAASGGILIRGVERLGPEPPAPALIDGPCMVVDHILALTASGSVEALAARCEPGIERAGPGSPLYLELLPGPGRAPAVHETARIGLTLRKGDTAARRWYLARPYRFLSEPARIRKGKPYLVTALHQQGRSPAEIAACAAAAPPR